MTFFRAQKYIQKWMTQSREIGTKRLKKWKSINIFKQKHVIEFLQAFRLQVSFGLALLLHGVLATCCPNWQWVLLLVFHERLVASSFNRIFKAIEFDQIFSCKRFCGQNMHLPISMMGAADSRLEKIWKLFAWSSHHFINIWYFKHFVCSFHN